MTGPSLHSPSPQDDKELSSGTYAPLFTRLRWRHEGVQIDRFFDHFVPLQYEMGFAWRCQVVGKGEESRARPFHEQPTRVQALIAANAEVLLELFEETSPAILDRMREAGQKLATLGVVDAARGLEGDIPELREEMSRRHHEKWFAQFTADLAAGKRIDADHRGAKPYNMLPEIELEIMKVQTWANWRVLGSLSDENYAMLRNLAAKSEACRTQ